MKLQEEYSKTHYLYTSLFCEENVWQLLQSLSSTNETSKMWALIITNPDKKIALFNQKANQATASSNLPVIWDYHVIMLAIINHQYQVFDFDTRLPFVCPVHDYLQNTFIHTDKLPYELIPYFRKIPAQSYLDRFSSDRSHMLSQIQTSEFPPWPIINADKKHCITLSDYLDTELILDDESLIHRVSSLEKLEQWLSLPTQ